MDVCVNGRGIGLTCVCRGFLWDEGFHELLVSRFDAELSRQIIASWYSGMDKNVRDPAVL